MIVKEFTDGKRMEPRQVWIELIMMETCRTRAGAEKIFRDLVKQGKLVEVKDC